MSVWSKPVSVYSYGTFYNAQQGGLVPFPGEEEWEKKQAEETQRKKKLGFKENRLDDAEPDMENPALATDERNYNSWTPSPSGSVDTTYGANTNTGSTPTAGDGTETPSVPVDTTYGANTNTGSTPTAGDGTETAAVTTPTYEEMEAEIRDKGKENAENLYNSTVEEIDRGLASKNQDIEADRVRAIDSARTDYDHNQSSYGAKAERIAQMGLTGSGYSDYLDSQAYAQYQGGVASANSDANKASRDAADLAESQRLAALQKRDETVAGLDTTYQRNMQIYNEGKKDARNAAYATILAGINTGAYDLEQVQQLASDNDLTPDQTTALTAAANDYASKVIAGNNASLGYGEGTVGYYESAKDAGSIDTAAAYSGIISAISSETNIDVLLAMDLPEYIEGEENGYSKEEVDHIRSVYERQILNGCFDGLGFADADRKYNLIITSGKLSKPALSQLKKEYDKKYVPVRTGASFYKDPDTWFAVTSPGAEGNNIEVKDKDGKVYHVEYGPAAELTRTDLNEIANSNSIQEKEIFALDGKIYVKYGDKIYTIQRRKKSYAEEWSAFYGLFYPS